ncbi:MAG: hypothetical protein PHU17_02790 [Candidatus Pacebacteria bacterium]|nr:hypothetical protein [Candidatus Paceibacterota bacterium]
MKKNNIIILSLFIFLTLGIVLFNYTNQLTSLIAEAVAPNPGHSWSELECTTDLCVTTTGVGIGTTIPTAKLYVEGDIIASGNIIASEPTVANHVATKDYVDNLPGLTWPDGGQPGDTLIMGVTGPFWDSPLTWPGSTKSAYDCDQIHGTVYNTGATGTICRYPGSTVPPGWTWADKWQRYSGSATFGGDSCGKNLSTQPIIFSNQDRIVRSRTGGMIGYQLTCGSAYDGIWSNPYCRDCVPSNYPSHSVATTISNTTTGRVEIGIY